MDRKPWLPWLPEAFHARFMVSTSFRPPADTKALCTRARKKKPPVLRVCKEIIGAFLRIIINNIFRDSLDHFEATKEEQVVEYLISQDLSVISQFGQLRWGSQGIMGAYNKGCSDLRGP